MVEQNTPNKPNTLEKNHNISNEDELEILQQNFFNKRKKYTSNRNILYSIVTLIFSTLIFLLVFFLFIPPSLLNDQLNSREFLNTIFASSLSLAISAGLVPLIIYIIARNMSIQKHNEELSSLFLQIKHLRNKILIDKQSKNIEDSNEPGGKTGESPTSPSPPPPEPTKIGPPDVAPSRASPSSRESGKAS
jgi:hypothetical protein